jgi:hypothetical protein
MLPTIHRDLAKRANLILSMHSKFDRKLMVALDRVWSLYEHRRAHSYYPGSIETMEECLRTIQRIVYLIETTHKELFPTHWHYEMNQKMKERIDAFSMS